MNDIDHYVGSDIGVSSSGDLALVTSSRMGLQRILRRLLTNPPETDAAGNVTATGDYLWHQNYGAGVPKQIGENVNVPEIKAMILGQMMLEASVAKTPEPVIAVTVIPEGVSVDVQYNDSVTGAQQFLSFDVNR